MNNVSGQTNPIAKRSLSRGLLLRLLILPAEWSRQSVASALCVSASTLRQFESGETLMPLDVQERLAAFVLENEPALRRIAHQLRGQVEAARRYQAGDVVRHATSPS